MLPFANSRNIVANSTVLVSPNACKLGNVIINTKGASSNTLTLYHGNGTAGSVIATIDTTSAVGFLPFWIMCPDGLTAVVGTGTAANVTITFG